MYLTHSINTCIIQIVHTPILQKKNLRRAKVLLPEKIGDGQSPNEATETDTGSNETNTNEKKTYFS